MAGFVRSLMRGSPDMPGVPPVEEGDAFYKPGVFPGAQGCVFVPSLIVKGITATRDKSYVTKIFIDEKSYTYEQTLNAFVKQIDIDSKFTNVKTNQNKIDLTKVSDADIKNCGAVIGSKEELATKKFLNYEYLGQSFHTIIGYRTPLSLTDAQNIFAGLQVLADKVYLMNNGRLGRVIYHNDIHYGNVMYSSSRNKVYLIDFGMATTETHSPRRDAMVDMRGLIQVTNQMLDYVITVVPNPTPKRTAAITAFQGFINANYLGKISAPAGFVPAYTGEDIIREISKLSAGFSELGGKRRKTIKNKHQNKDKTLRRRKMRRNVH